jgi:hypothetical protein
MLEGNGAGEPLLTLAAIVTAPFRHRLEILTGIAIETLVHGPDRGLADVSLICPSASYPMASLSTLIPYATLGQAVGCTNFTISAGAQLTFTPAGPISSGQVFLDASFVTTGAPIPYDGAIAIWPYS